MTRARSRSFTTCSRRPAHASTDLRKRGLTPIERAALDLLTRRDGETFERHTLRIGDGDGPAGAIARSVKLADLEDHIGLARDASPHPPYTWARRHVLASQHRRHETPGERPPPPRRSLASLLTRPLSTAG